LRRRVIYTDKDAVHTSFGSRATCSERTANWCVALAGPLRVERGGIVETSAIDAC
jgi:hypothetical protein